MTDFAIVMPNMLSHLGEWEGVYTHIDRDGTLIDRHRTWTRCEFPTRGDIAYLQSNRMTWDDGRVVERSFGGTFRDGLRRWDTDRFVGIGAALAVARLEGVEALADVLGLAYSFCAGTMQAHVEGSIALPLQIANAARSAIMAVDLAKSGLTGPHEALEGPFGYFTLIDRGDLSSYTDRIGERWLISDVSTKPYPSGRASHGALGTIATLGVAPEEAQRIELFAPPLIKRLVGRPFHAALTPAYARLCLPLLAALMLRNGRIDPRRFTPATFADPALADLAGRVSVNDDGNPDPNALSPQRLVLTLKDGNVIEHLIPATLGSPDAPLSPVQTAAKRDLARILAADADPRLFDAPLAWFTEPQ